MKHREIKFRSWKDEKMYYSDTCSRNFIFYEFFEQFCSDENESMQYTGLKDKNGKEIYEGDIIKWNHPMEDIGVVEYIITQDFNAPSPNQCYFGLNVKRLGICHFQSDDMYEVIGNIFENPELTK